jgi:EAL domain-containing protein (putative c-di-GMP-specific phosphodiesterase class I)
VLQPVIATRSGEITGYEGLVRGPVDSPLHMPAWLFSVAERYGLQSAVEHLSREIVIETFVGMALPGKLFLNVSPEVLTQNSASNGNLVAYLQTAGLPPDRVIIELTENQPTPDLARMREALLYYRGLGFEVAIDDLGEGFSSLRLWSELRPEFVKVDKHFILGVSQDPLKLEFVRAIQQIASCCGSRVIAEGIETRQDFRVIRDLGIAYSQGYFIAKPDATPAREASAELRRAVQDCGIAVYPGNERVSNRAIKARKLMIAVEPVSPETENDRV